MSIRKIIGAILAIVIGYIVVTMLLAAVAHFITLPGLVVTLIWGLAAICAILIIAWAFDIPIPFFTWSIVALLIIGAHVAPAHAVVLPMLGMHVPI
jgi:hypothetical protein